MIDNVFLTHIFLDITKHIFSLRLNHDDTLKMEPAGCVNCLPLYHWNSLGGNRGTSLPHQPNHHQGDARTQNCPGTQATQDGQGYTSFA